MLPCALGTCLLIKVLIKLRAGKKPFNYLLLPQIQKPGYEIVELDVDGG